MLINLETLQRVLLQNNSGLLQAGRDALKKRKYPIFVTLSLWVECLRERSHSIPVLRVQIDVTKVSIKKMDITGNNEVAGARLLLKDKEGNVIESWMSATEAHVFEQKLIAGETYTLAEVTAPSGYEVAAELHLL